MKSWFQADAFKWVNVLYRYVTVVETEGDTACFDLIVETLRATNLGRAPHVVYSTSSTSSSYDWLKDLSANEKDEWRMCRPMRRLSPSTCAATPRRARARRARQLRALGAGRAAARPLPGVTRSVTTWTTLAVIHQ